MRDIRAMNPAPVADLFDGKREQCFIDLEGEINLLALDELFGQMLTLVTPVTLDSRRAPRRLKQPRTGS